jgi:hypothetical protein
MNVLKRSVSMLRIDDALSCPVANLIRLAVIESRAMLPGQV